jgi:5'-3' exonuclease
MKTTLLIDGTNIMYASHFVASSSPDCVGEEEVFAMWRFIFLKMILAAKQKFEPVSDLVIAIDGRTSWRKDIFPYYKARRVLKRQESDTDWGPFFEFADNAFNEMISAFPFKIIKLDKVEADDTLATLAIRLNKDREQIIIVSRDKDFFQLCKYPNIKIYNPIENKFIKDGETADPFLYAIEHLIKGDPGDDIPNILSEDKIFLIDGKRQKSITAKILAEVHDKGLEEWVKERNLEDNFKRNKKLILLDEENIPEDIQEKIMYEYNTSNPKNEWFRIDKYLKSKAMRTLYDCAGDFCIKN